MLANLRSRLTYANVMATIAAFVALGGTSYAVATGSIDSREIKNNTVRSKDVRNESLLSRDVKNSSLVARDFAPGQLPKGAAGATGLTGPQGPRGLQGLTGPPGPTAAAPARESDANALIGSTESVMDLADLNDDSGDQRVTTTFTSTLMVTASVDIEYFDAAPVRTVVPTSSATQARRPGTSGASRPPLSAW